MPTTWRRVGSPARIAASSAVLSISLAPKVYPATAIRTVGSIWATRSTTLRAPNSGAQEAQIAPREAQARKATSASGMFGTNATTRSPRPTPSRRSPARARPTCSASSPKVSSLRSRVCEYAISATVSRSSGRPSMCSA